MSCDLVPYCTLLEASSKTKGIIVPAELGVHQNKKDGTTCLTAQPSNSKAATTHLD
jgi:hypothetical protein